MRKLLCLILFLIKMLPQVFSREFYAIWQINTVQAKSMGLNFWYYKKTPVNITEKVC